MAGLCMLFILLFKTLLEGNYKYEVMILVFTCLHGIIISSVILPYVNPFVLIAFSNYSEYRRNQRLDMRIAARKGICNSEFK